MKNSRTLKIILFSTAALFAAGTFAISTPHSATSTNSPKLPAFNPSTFLLMPEQYRAQPAPQAEIEAPEPCATSIIKMLGEQACNKAVSVMRMATVLQDEDRIQDALNLLYFDIRSTLRDGRLVDIDEFVRLRTLMRASGRLAEYKATLDNLPTSYEDKIDLLSDHAFYLDQAGLTEEGEAILKNNIAEFSGTRAIREYIVYLVNRDRVGEAQNLLINTLKTASPGDTEKLQTSITLLASAINGE